MSRVGVLGAGTMGAGIAQVAALSGWEVALYDIDPGFVRQQVEALGRQLDRQVERGRLTGEQRAAAVARLTVVSSLEAFRTCELIIEAIVEDLEIKARALAPLAAEARTDAIFASNTSSLSIATLAQRTAELATARGADCTALPARFVGMHFFNPVPLMPLVEVIAGQASGPEAVARTAQIARDWGKTVVMARDTPGFIVNRVARGFYLEALRMLGEGVAGVDEIDRTVKRLGGFRMGPFELMDLIGIDVNYSVTTSVWEQLGRPPRLAPHPIQAGLVERGALGRKTRRGFYDYNVEPAIPAITTPRQSFDLPPAVYEAVRRCADAAVVADTAGEAGSITEQYILMRILAAILNEAAFAAAEQVATPADIDTAMTLGTNYPLGPLAWADRIGRYTLATLLRHLDSATSAGRFTPAPGLTS